MPPFSQCLYHQSAGHLAENNSFNVLTNSLMLCHPVLRVYLVDQLSYSNYGTEKKFSYNKDSFSRIIQQALRNSCELLRQRKELHTSS